VVAALGTASETAHELATSGGGVLVPPAAPAALAEAILRLRADPDEAMGLAERGRHYALTQLSAGSSLAQYERFIETLIAMESPAS
jgi:glycosyltransferase involved in cell wall biosynthesis